jgi:hypothetical protein
MKAGAALLRTDGNLFIVPSFGHVVGRRRASRLGGPREIRKESSKALLGVVQRSACGPEFQVMGRGGPRVVREVTAVWLASGLLSAGRSAEAKGGGFGACPAAHVTPGRNCRSISRKDALCGATVMSCNSLEVARGAGGGIISKIRKKGFKFL